MQILRDRFKYIGQSRQICIAPYEESNRLLIKNHWARQFKQFGGKRFASVENQAYGTYTAMAVTALQSLAYASASPYAGWQSSRVDNITSLKASDFEVQILLSTAATAPATEQAVVVYVVPWMQDGALAWTPMANFGTIVRPTGTDAACSITEPNSMLGPVTFPYRVTSQPIDGGFTIASVCGWMPDGWSLAIRNTTGAALGTGCIVAYKPLTYTNT